MNVNFPTIGPEWVPCKAGQLHTLDNVASMPEHLAPPNSGARDSEEQNGGENTKSGRERRKERTKLYKQAKRAQNATPKQVHDFRINESHSRRFPEDTHLIPTGFAFARSSAARTAGAGRAHVASFPTLRIPTLEEALQEGLELEHWDGVTPKVFTSGDDEIFVVAVGHPPDNGHTWDDVIAGMQEAVKRLQRRLHFRGTGNVARYESSRTIASGISYGGGLEEPCNLKQTRENQAALDEFYDDRNVRRIVGYGSLMFAYYFPFLYQEYMHTTLKLEAHYPYLRRNGPNTVFAAASVNVGPQAVAREHRDARNKSNGICPIWCGGSFDYRKGGHIILRQLGKILEFPPGALVLVPSTMLSYGNTAIGADETRISFTQYSTAALFRWVQTNLRGEKELVDKHNLPQEATQKQEKAHNPFSKVNELSDDHVATGIVRMRSKK